MTKRENLMTLANLDAVKANDELTYFIAHELELLDRKTVKRSIEPSKAQKENDRLVGIVADYLAENGATNTTAIAKALDVSNQKATAVLKRGVANGIIFKSADKKPIFGVEPFNAE